MVAALAVTLNAASNAIHAVNVVSVPKVKASVVMVVVVTHAVVVVENAMQNVAGNVALSAPPSALIHETNLALKAEAKGEMKAEMKAVKKVAARVQTLEINAMNLAWMQKATKLLRII
jgi:L-asparaginase/Glu-tRNA(Gln) amidotransferase subunit D